MFKPQPSLFILLACVACGSNFEAGGTGGATGSDGGAPQAGASAMGGDTSNGASAGESSAGANTAGESSAGGHATAGGGGAAHGGASSGGTSAGGSSGGNASGGSAGTDCAALKTEYAALVKKARVCNQGSTDECSTASKAPTVGCGCPTLVNANSEYTALAAEKYKAIQKNNCDGGLTCGIACLAPTGANCAQSNGTGTSEFVCTATNGGVAN
jgi:hypothetical protein